MKKQFVSTQTDLEKKEKADQEEKYREIDLKLQKHTNLDEDIKYNERRLEDLKKQTEDMEEYSNKLKLDLTQNKNEFRRKAQEILPFIEMLNFQKTDLEDTPKAFFPSQQSDFHDGTSIIKDVTRRILDQNFEPEDDSFIPCVVTLFLSSTFIGF